MPNILFIFMVDSSCLRHASFRFLSRNHSVITSIPLYYHPILSPYFPASQVLGVNSPSKYSSIASTCSRVFYAIFVHQPRIVFGYFCYGFTTQRYAEYPCAPLGSLMLGNISPSKKSQENAIFLAHLHFFCYFCTLKLQNA